MSDHGHGHAPAKSSHAPKSSGGGKDAALVEGSLAFTVVAVPGIVAGLLMSLFGGH